MGEDHATFAWGRCDVQVGEEGTDYHSRAEVKTVLIFTSQSPQSRVLQTISSCLWICPLQTEGIPTTLQEASLASANDGAAT